MFLKVKEYKAQPITVAQHKYDGYYCEIFKGDNGEIRVQLKGGDCVWQHLCHMRMNHIAQPILEAPNGMHLCGELYAPGVPATSVVTMIKAGDPNLRLRIFAMPEWAGEDTTGMSIESVNALLAKWKFDPAHSVRLCDEPEVLVPSCIESLLRQAVDEGFEGWVLKEAHCKGWYKLKPKRTVDCFVTGYTVSDSISFFGGLKAIQVSVRIDGHGGSKNRHIASVGSGFLAEYRMEVALESLVGRICEVEYDCVAANGKLRFPRFIRWRDDEKFHKDCMEDQL